MAQPPKEAASATGAELPAGLDPERLFSGDRVALARALTAAENETPAGLALARAIAGHLGNALVLGFTGAPGAGKSTLVNACIGELRRRGRSVGVLAVDPSSPVTGGAILGDRIRMSDHGGDEGVFIRSVASRGHLGGLSATTSRLIDVMDAAGKDVVIVETVGTGQSEVEIADLADIRIIVNAPGLGDDIQALKAGILEIGDILVVNKGDRPEAGECARQLSAMAAMGGRERPVIVTTATTGEGVDKLVDAIGELAAKMHRRLSPAGRAARILRLDAQRRFRDLLNRSLSEEIETLAREITAGRSGFADAAKTVIRKAAERLRAESPHGK